jgi:hypothetical protein
VIVARYEILFPVGRVLVEETQSDADLSRAAS